MNKKLLLTILTLGLLGCNNEDSKIIDLTTLKLTEGFVDVPLSIIDKKELDNYFEYNACATLNKDTVGIIVRLKKGIPAGFINGEPKNMLKNPSYSIYSL